MMPEKKIHDESAAAAKEKDAALIGAKAVAAAVSKVADAAVAEVQKTPATSGPGPDLTARGTIGGRFVLVGTGFGASGTVLLNGVQLETLSWSTTQIEGKLPVDAKSGAVVVQLAESKRTGYLQL